MTTLASHPATDRPAPTTDAVFIRDRRVLRVWTSGERQSWVYLEGAGWRRVCTATPAGRRLLATCRTARTDGWTTVALVTRDDLFHLELLSAPPGSH